MPMFEAPGQGGGGMPPQAMQQRQPPAPVPPGGQMGPDHAIQALANQLYILQQQQVQLQQELARMRSSKVKMDFHVFHNDQGRIHLITATEGYHDG